VNLPIIEPDYSVIAGLFAARENAGAVFYDDYMFTTTTSAAAH
jgi:hypothetical protein